MSKKKQCLIDYAKGQAPTLGSVKCTSEQVHQSYRTLQAPLRRSKEGCKLQSLVQLQFHHRQVRGTDHPLWTSLLGLLVIHVKGVEKLCLELAAGLTTILHSRWSLTANVSPFFEKGSYCHPENIRSVSLNCATYKVLEHVICSHTRNHLERDGILIYPQHDSARSSPVRHSN